MDDKDNRSNSNRTKGDISFLVVVQYVSLCQRERVGKNQFGGAEINAVLCKIFAVLLSVPFKGHDFNLGIISQMYVQKYIHSEAGASAQFPRAKAHFRTAKTATIPTPSTPLPLLPRRPGFAGAR